MSRSEIARRLGVTRQAVSAAIKTGRITLLPDGTLDPETAPEQFRSKVDPAKNRGRRPSQIAEAAVLADKGPDIEVEAPSRVLDDEEPAAPAPAGKGGPAFKPDEVMRKLASGEAIDFWEARTANEILKARAAARKLEELERKLLPAAEVQAVREAENTALRDRIRAVPMAVAEPLLDVVTKGGGAPGIAAALLAALEEMGTAEIEVDPDIARVDLAAGGEDDGGGEEGPPTAA